MSVVVAVKRGGQTVMASDSITVSGNDEVMPGPPTVKVIRFGSVLIGRVGWAVYGNVLADLLRSKKKRPPLRTKAEIYRFFLWLRKRLQADYGIERITPSDDSSPFFDLDCRFLVANKQGIFHVSRDMSVQDVGDWYAMGAGGEYALGALQAYGNTGDGSAAYIATRAVSIACALNAYCRQPVMMEIL